MRSIVPIGLQLFSVRGEVQKDLAATLKAVADLGYVAAEPWGYNGEKLEWMGHSPKDIRAMYDDNGLVCCGIHLATGALHGRQPRPHRRAEPHPRQPLPGHRRRQAAHVQLEGVKELAGILNNAAEKVASQGHVRRLPRARLRLHGPWTARRPGTASSAARAKR